jgi:glycosyltransferase involved in cell wall biosynthesis
MPDEPLVSIGLPTYNRLATLRRAIESALAQDYQNFELVISDNASTDGTEDYCREVCRRDKRVRYTRQPKNLGPTVNFREVLVQARGELFMWLPDDDWLDPAFVSQCANFASAHPDYALVCGGAKYYRGEDFLYQDLLMNLTQDSGAERVVEYFRQVRSNGEHYGLMRRAYLLETPYPHTLGGDWVFIASIVFKGKLKTIESVCVNRSADGLSRDLGDLAAYFGFTGSQAKNPHRTIAGIVFKDIGWQSPVYRPLGKVGRLVLALRAAEAVGLKSFLPSWGIRTRLRQAVRGVS